MNVETIFKKGSADLSVAIAHSTQDNLGEYTADVLERALNVGVRVQKRRITDFHDLLNALQEFTHFDVLVLFAHGRKVDNKVRLFADYDDRGRPLRVNVGEMKAALETTVSDKLCLFGVCYYGTEDLADAVCSQAGALACIAPIPGSSIGAMEAVHAFSAILNKMQEQKHISFDLRLLRSVLLPEIHTAIRSKLNIFPLADG